MPLCSPRRRAVCREDPATPRHAALDRLVERSDGGHSAVLASARRVVYETSTIEHVRMCAAVLLLL